MPHSEHFTSVLSEWNKVSCTLQTCKLKNLYKHKNLTLAIHFKKSSPELASLKCSGLIITPYINVL